MTNDRKKWFFSVCILFLFLGVGEVMARISFFESMPKGTPLEQERDLGWQLPQNDVDKDGHPVRRDAQGMRVTPKRDDKALLVYTTGDSSIFGHGLNDEETLHAHIEQQALLNDLSVKAITGAVPGYSSVQSLNQLFKIGWQQKPDLLIIGNLWSDNDIMNETQLHNQAHAPKEEESWMMRNSALWRWISIELTLEGDPFQAVGWMEEWHNKSGFRRVAPTRYASILDRMIREAGARNISVLLLSPCNRPLAAKESLDSGYPWDIYFEIMNDVAQYRNVPIVCGCDVAHEQQLKGDVGFLDRMHPTSRLNQAYAQSILHVLKQKQWPKQPLSLDVHQPPYSKIWKDTWPTVYLEPKGAAYNLRPDNVIHDQSRQHKAGPRPH